MRRRRAERCAAAAIVGALACLLHHPCAAAPSDICRQEVMQQCKNSPLEARYEDESCKCICSNQWRTPAGAQWGDGNGCSECPSQYSGANCDSCAEGSFGEPPNCDPCRERTHCSDHASAMNVAGGEGTCGCRCRNHWEKCTSAAGCTSNPEYECGFCPEEYDPATDCKDCAKDRLVVDNCRKCTSKADCSDHASDVEPEAPGRTKCKCTCRNKWEGPTCSTCRTNWEEREDCGKCKVLHYGSDCENVCNLKTDCGGNANNVVVNDKGTGCDCWCDEEWDGADCTSCSANAIEEGGGCKLCTSEEHCSGHAVPVKVTTESPPRNVVAADAGHKSCVCNCRNHWEDGTGKCDVCPEEYEGDCDTCKKGSYGDGADCRKCALADCGEPGTAAECSSDGPKKPNKARLICKCEASYESEKGEVPGEAGWYYGKCSRCKKDAVGSPPNCLLCKEAAPGAADTKEAPQCYGHATGVEANAARTSCVCLCEDEYEEDASAVGGHCDTCKAGYFREEDKPTAACKKCDVATHCNNHATRVTSSRDRAQCDCTCANAWENDGSGQCNKCDSNRYEEGSGSPGCDKCKAKHINFGPPTDPSACELCEVGAHCGGRADDVDTDPLQTKCVCDCKEQYEGDACDKCADGYVDFDTCRKCSLSTDCESDATYGDHAEEVNSDRPRKNCVCKCKSNYAGTRCDECAEGHINYPQCDKCTGAKHCSGHADPGTRSDGVPAAVETDGGKTRCECTCRNKYSGDTCGVCPAEYLDESEGADCDKCRNGQIYPSCGACTEEHCSFHSDKVEPKADKSGCICTCTPPWEGEICDKCPKPWDPASDCKRCLPPYVPDSTGKQCRKCTIQDDCSGNAKEVTSDGLTCQCKGSDEYCTRANGQIIRNNGSCACGTGEPGYQGYCPCGDVTVAPYRCWWWGTCNGMWGGGNCGTCPPQYNATRGCGWCSRGYVNYPWCRRCHIGRDCGARALAVESDEEGRYCRCQCKPGYRWDRGVGCYRCAIGYVDWSYAWRREYRGVAPMEQPLPVVTRTMTPTETLTPGLCNPYRCSVHDDCENHASSVTSDESNQHCICNCLENFESPHWYWNYSHDIDQGYDPKNGTKQCDGCAPGYHTYPDCFRCTNVDDCSGNAINVTDDGTRTSCKCTCYGQFTGDKCETCPPQFGDDKNCDACAPGRVAYPTCIACDNDMHCSSHAAAVTDDGSGTSCVCTCRNQWGGARGTCAECPPMYDEAQDCGACANNGVGYPACGAACTVALNCSNHARSVECEGPGCTGSGSVSCKCDCFEGFTKPDCEKCEEGRCGSACETCCRGYETSEDGKTCIKCTSQTHCNGHAEGKANSVMSIQDPTRINARKCICAVCDGNWFGEACQYCPRQYGGDLEARRVGGTCDKCSTDGVDVWAGTAPNCKKCDPAQCNGRSDGMIANGSLCVCNCRGAWSGEYCDYCDFAKYDETSDCDRCHPGHGHFPDCKMCDLQGDCEGMAEDVESDGISCFCSCNKEWCGGYGRCDVSAGRFPADRPRVEFNITATATPTLACRGIFDSLRRRPGGLSRTPTITPTLTLDARMRAAPPDDSGGVSAAAWAVPLCLLAAGGIVAGLLWRRRQQDAQAANALADLEKGTGRKGGAGWRMSLQEEMMAGKKDSDSESSDGGRAALDDAPAPAAAEGMGSAEAEQVDDDDGDRMEV
eukprot:TRINITY_DN49877_c0_g1_i1.p1 TRINITY_DN49877_c0_g1~~TRINITY_DN49877_c0_g1_i1.p1  ORF type:complete len:1707 (+),score=379.04 TRINITY_DN49877_c0_g1_i1:75-5123(+)